MNELRSKLEDAISQGFREETLAKVKKQIKTVFDEAESDFEYWIKADIPYNLAHFVERMAEEAIDAILRGDEDTMRARLSCVEGNWTGRDRKHPVIHGRLFEQGAIALRKQIVDAFPDLLKNERILDLEDQVKSLTGQVTKLNADMERERVERLVF